MRAKPFCFISYSQSDMDPDLFEYLIEIFKDGLTDKVDILLDADLPIGKDWNKFMDKVNDAAAVLLLLTPDYRKKIEERRGGVYTEFNIIWNRYQELFEGNTGQDECSFEIIPILISGNKQTSIPEELRTLKYLNLTGLRVRRNKSGKFYVTKPDKLKYLPKLERIVHRISTCAVMRTEGYLTLQNRYFDDLFIDLKADWDRTVDGRNLLNNLFVKTQSYRRIANQRAYFAVGRKGSGKSTLVQVLPIFQHNTYFETINIVADKFNLESLFSLYSSPKFRSDTMTIIPRQKAFEYVWEVTIMLAVMNEFVKHRDELYGISSQILNTLEGRTKEIIGQHTQWSVADYYNYSFQKIVDFIDEIIQNARSQEDVFFVDIQASFNLENFIDYVLEKDITNAWWSVIKILENKFLITLDGFDNAFDEFRLESLRRNDHTFIARRSFFEIDWLRSLLNFVIRAKSTMRDNAFYALLDFCIVAPMDRFLEVVRVDRDSYRNWNRWFFIQWSGIELSILLRKRLEKLIEFKTNSDLTPQQRLEQIMNREEFKHIPKFIEYEFNGRKYRLPLFMYVLRHTFWRPRDILIYYADILALSDSLAKKKFEVTSEAIRKVIKSSSRKIIESEFIGEIAKTIYNIEDIVNAFRRKKWYLEYPELRSIVDKINFKFATGDLEDSDIVAKVRFLYDIGFLGLNLTEKQQSHLAHWHHNVFYFNEGRSIFSDRFLDELDLQEFSFIIHPIFAEFLRLDTTIGDMPLIFDWTYLQKSEAALFARMQS